MAASQQMGRYATDSFLVPPTQELFDAMAAAGKDDDSHDNVPLKGYPEI